MNRQKLILLITTVLALLLVIGGVIGALLRLLNEIRYSLEFFLPYWLVNPILLISIGLFLTLLVQVGWPWWKEFIRKNKHKLQKNLDRSPLPKSRRQAAKISLESIDRLLERLQNDVAREGLKQERERVARELARGDLVVVFFGTGSSGKTSLIRALLNEIVGEVGAPMGSTKTSQTYRLRLKGLDRSLKLVDTPGILEAGRGGQSREKESKVKASRADLMIVVVDGDLRSSELEAIKVLATLGKRLLLVLNKCDLRGEEEEQRLLTLLRGHCKGLIEPENILSTSASPQSIPRPGTRPWQPPAEVDDLLKRLAKVLHADGEELIADNILMQCRNLGATGRQLLSKQRQREAQRCIDRYSWISSGVVVATPLPGVDLLGTAAVNTQMVMEIAKIYGIEMTRVRAQELAISVGKTLTGLGIAKGGITIITASLNLSLPTLLLGRAIQGVVAAWLTRVAGASFITYFKQDQDWGDGGIQEVVQHQYELNKRDSSLKKFLEVALQRVVEPLQRNQHLKLPPRSRPQVEEEALDPEHLER